MKLQQSYCPLLGPFEVHDFIAEGAVGTVFSGLHVGQGVPVAIKAITGSHSLNAEVRDRFRREVQAAAALNHPGVVMVFDYGEVGPRARPIEGLPQGTLYYVMPLIERGTLRQLVGKISFSELESILLTLLDALAHAHAAGVIHRDIKPENILLGSWKGRIIPKLADFGLSQAFRTGDSTRTFIGSPRYMAPEQIDRPSRTHGPWSDLYSLGCVAFELISGRPLFDGMNVRAIYRKQSGASLPRLDDRMLGRESLKGTGFQECGFQDWLDTMLAANPQQRFSSAADAARALVDLDIGRFDRGGADAATSHRIARLTPVLDPILAAHAPPPTSSCRQENDERPDRFPSPKIRPRSMRFVGAGLGLYELRTIPMIGREDELDFMWRALRNVEETNESRAVIVRGHQGCGKTRLVSWFARRLKELGAATVLQASHSQEGGPSDGLAMMLARHFRIPGTSDADARKVVSEALEDDEKSDSYDTDLMMRIVRPHADASSASAPLAIATPEQRYAVIRRFLATLATKRPVVVWLDDAHWGHDALELVRFVTQVRTDDLGPVLFVATVTDDALATSEGASAMVHGLVAEEHVDELSLEALDDVEQEKLVQQLLLLDDDLVSEVVIRTAGNPLFAVELVGDWVRQGVLQAGDFGFVLRDHVEPTLPDHLHEICTRRLNDVICAHGAQARLALELAAALGQSVATNEWREVCRLANVLCERSLVDAFIERRFAHRTDNGWMFNHSLLRESIERTAGEAGRWEAWRRCCADMMESLYDVNDPAVAERFGRYAMSGGEYARALEVMIEGGYRQRLGGDYRAAQRLFAASLECLDKMKVPADDSRWGHVWARRASVSLCQLQPREVSRWAKQAQAAAQEHQWDDIEAQATAFLGVAKQWMGECDTSDCLKQACALLRGVDADRYAIDAYAAAAQGLSRLGEHASVEWLLDRELEISMKLGDRRAVANSYYMRCRDAFFQEDWQTSLANAEQAVAICDEIGHLPGKNMALEIMAEVYRRTGDTAHAEKMYQEVLSTCEALGLPTAIAKLNLAILLIHRGAVEEAEEYFAQALDEFEAAGRKQFSAVAVAGRLVCAAAQGWGAAVDEYLEALAEMVADADVAERDLALLLELGAKHLRRGEHACHAGRTYRLALTQWQRIGNETRAEDVRAKIRLLS